MITAEQLVESARKPGFFGLVGKSIEKRAQRDFRAYFQLLGQKIAGLELEKYASLEPEQAKGAVMLALSNTLRVTSPMLKLMLKTNIEHAINLSAPSVSAFAEADDDPSRKELDQLGVTGEAAGEYAEVRSGQQVQGINATTLRDLQDAIAQGITDRAGVDGLSRIIRSTLADFEKFRADVIATTEMNDAMSHATLTKLQVLGIENVVWLVTEDERLCPICSVNADVIVPTGEPFPSGDLRPPAHPNCRCAISGSRAEDSEESFQEYSDDEARDEQGRWTAGGSAGFSKKGSENFKRAVDDFTAGEHDQISTSVANALKSGEIDPEKGPGHALAHAIREGGQQGTIYRGLAMDHEGDKKYFAHLKKGDVLDIPDAQSFSRDEKVARLFTTEDSPAFSGLPIERPVIIKAENSSGFYVGKMSNYQGGEKQKEVITNGSFKVLGNTIEKDGTRVVHVSHMGVH